MSSAKAQATITAKKLPICVFALANDQLNSALSKELLEAGIKAVFVTNDSQLSALQVLPECFATFVDLKAFPSALNYIRNRKTVEKSFWVAAVPRLNTTQNATLYNMGMVDILTLPVHPFTFKSRARLLLARFVKQHGMPIDVLLPDGIFNVEKETRLTKDEDKSSFLKGESLGQNTFVGRPTVYLSGTSGIFGNHKVSTERIAFYDHAVKQMLPSPQLFKPVTSTSKRNFFLKEARDKGANATLWTRQQKWKGQFDIISYYAHSNSLILAYSKENDRFSCARTFKEFAGEPLIYLSFSLVRARVFSPMELSQIQTPPEGLTLKVSNELFETQRRSHFRLRWKDTSERMQIKVMSQQGVASQFYPAADLSANGCKLCVNETQAAAFSVGQICPKITLKIYDKNIECTGVVRWKSDGRLGIQFLSIQDADEKGLQLYIMEESYEYLKNYIEP